MTYEEKVQQALKYGDFYELALLTYERENNEHREGISDHTKSNNN